VEPGRGVHPLIHVALLDIDVSIQVDDPHTPFDVGRDRPHVRVADRMVTADHDRERALLVHERHGAIDLIEGLLDIGRDHEDVAGVAQVELLVPAGA
jgi:hypothetical protein